MRLPAHPAFTHGFSLCEVSLALGIMAFAVVSLLGLLPVAIQSARDSLDTSVAVALSERLAQTLKQQPFDSLPKGGEPTTLYFNDAGLRVNSNSGATFRAVQRIEATPGSNNLLQAQITLTRIGGNPRERSFCYLIFNND